MDSYRISKAWHLGHEVAESIQGLIKVLRKDEDNTPSYLKALSVMVPHYIALSAKKRSKTEKLKCFEQARQASIDLLERLDKLKDQKLIEEDYYKRNAFKLIEVQKQLTTIIRKLKDELSAVEKQNTRSSRLKIRKESRWH